MADPTHSIRAEQLQIDVASEALALALQPRVSDLNRQRLLPVIERVLGELDVPGRHIRLDRVAVDLGELPLAGLEEAAEAALYDALHRSLRAAIDDQEIGSDAKSGGPEAGLVELLAQYLQRGTLPFWAASVGMPRGGFSAAGLVQRLATGAPLDLAAMIRRVGRGPRVLERLVLALDEATLQSVLRLLEPAHAALILAYMLDLRHIHRAEPILSLGDTAFERHLWVLTLSYLVRDPGTQFNRKSFVAALLQGMAQGEGLDYRMVVAALERGLRVTLRHLPLASSLPAVIREIANDLEGTPPADATAESASPRGDSDTDPSALAALVRRYASDRQMLERLISRLDETTLQDVLRLLEPVHAVLIVAYLLDLRHFHRAEPLLPLGEVDFARVLWVVTFSYLVRDAGSQFNRRSFVRALLEELARSEGVDYAALVATLARGLASTAIRRPLASSLPAVIDEIVRDVDSDGVAAGVTAQPDEAFAGTDPSALAVFIRRYGGDRWKIERLVGRLDDTTLEAALRSLEPGQADLIISYLLDLRRVHRAAPLSSQSDIIFGRLLWVLTLSYLAKEASSQFDPTNFVRAMLEGMTQSEGFASDALLATLTGALRMIAGRETTASSLAAAIEALSLEAPRVSAVTEGPAAAVERYVRLDALAYYLRHGVLPIDVLLHRHDLSAEMLLADLPSLGIGRLRALLSAFSADERLRALRRAIRGLSADALAAWLRHLLLPSAEQESPLSAALAAAAAASPHTDIFYSHFIAALLDGGDLDLEAIGAASARLLSEETPDWAQPATWPAPHLQAALLAGLRDADASGAGSDWLELLDILLTRYPAEAKSFLHAVSGSADRDALIARLPQPIFHRLFALARPAEAQVLEFLLTAIAELPMSGRSISDVALRHAILVETLRVGSGADTVQDVMARVLRAAFGEGAPVPTAHRLIAAAGRAALPEAALPALAELLLAEPEVGAAPVAAEPLIAMRDLSFDWLRGEAAPSLSLDVVLSALPGIIEAFPDEVRAFLTRHAGHPSLRDQWTKRLPESALGRLVHALEPGRFRSFIDGAELLHDASVETALASHRPLPQRAVMWDALFVYLAATPAVERSLKDFVAGVMARSADDGDALRLSATRLARAANRQSLVDALVRERAMAAPIQTPQTRAREMPRSLRAKTAFGMDEAEVPEGEPIYIDNAGLVLAGVFLPHLFRSLDFLVPGEAGRTEMRDHDAASRAVHLLQYLIDGRCSVPEPLLVLNKIMCGVAVEAPVLREIVPTDHERTLCDSLLGAMIARWEIIQSSSTEALRETFLKREGRLVRKTDAWELRVDRKTVDVLVDRVPWNVGLIFNSWMQQPLHVTW